MGGKGFKFTEYYDPPHETQMKSLLEGAQAQRQPDGRVLVTECQISNLPRDRRGRTDRGSPPCFYDQGQRSISSSGPLHVQTADGKFSIEGEGFLWQQTNSTLLVSNRVHTISILSCSGRKPPQPPRTQCAGGSSPGH